MRGEPWVHLPNDQELASWGRQEEIAFNQQNRARERWEFFVRAFDYLTDSKIDGDYHEFGSHRCRTIRMALSAARMHNLDKMRFVVYDSFAGLPDPSPYDGDPRWKAGALTTSLRTFRDLTRAHGIYVDRIEAVKGYYHDTLTDPDAKPQTIAFANVDCDLYESAIYVFRYVDTQLEPGSIVYLDDYFVGNKGDPNKGVARAWDEYTRGLRCSWKFVPHLTVGWWGRSFIAVAR